MTGSQESPVSEVSAQSAQSACAPMPRTDLWALVEWRAERTPDAEMLVEEHGRRLSFRAYRDRAERVAGALAQRGVSEGTPVTWMFPTTIEALVLTAALARLGAVQNPVIPIYGPRDLGFMTRQTGARLLVAAAEWNGKDLRATVEQVAASASASASGPGPGPGLDLIVVDDDDDDLPESSPPPPSASPVISQFPSTATARSRESGGGRAGDPVRWVFYTSGTTSEPKGARHTDASVLATGRCMGERLACTEHDRVGLAFPVAHIGGCGTWLAACLQYGCALILDAAFEPERTAALQRREGVTLTGSGAVFVQAFLAVQGRHPQEPLFPHLRALTSGGAPKPVTLHAEAKEVLGGAGVLSGYGMTEAPILTMSALDDPDDVLATTEGRATEGVELRVVDAAGRVLGPGEEGELRAKGPQVMQGYVDAALDAGVFDAEGFLRTGDLARIDQRGNVTITGRIKDVIIRKGENISARAVEEELLRHPDVADVAVIGLPDRVRGELVCAVIVPAAGAVPPSLADLTAFLHERGLPSRQWPERLEVVDALPRNPTGKVRKTELRDRCAPRRS